MQKFKQWAYLATSLTLLCIVTACGAPATGLTPGDPTSEAVTPDTTPTEVAPDSTATGDGVEMPTATATGDGETAGALDGTSWQLVAYGPEGSMQAVNGIVTVLFGPNNEISGSGGCNSYGGTYTYDGQSFSTSNIASTEMACMGGANDIMAQETAFYNALNTATTLVIEGDELRITYPDGVLRFATPDAAATTPDATSNPDTPVTPGGQASGELDGTSWQLTEYGAEDSPQTANGELTLIFGPGDTISGNGGCNTFGGTYLRQGESFTTSQLVSTMMACADNSLTEQEGVYTRALTNATALMIEGDELRITYPDGVLRFTKLGAAATPPLEGTRWELITFTTVDGDTAAGTSLVNGSEITAEWNSGTVRGSAGCNQYSAPYTLEGDTLTVGDVITTRMACDGPIMEQEQTFVDALGAATALTVDGDRLVVTHPNGSLEFAAITE
jgi:heat shock protein HslJ